MTDRLTVARLVLTAVAIVLWGYGLKVDDTNIRVVAMAVLGVSLILRFVKRFVNKPPSAPE